MEKNLNIEIKNIQKLKLEQIFFKDFISFPYYSLIEFLKSEAEDNPFLDFEFDESKIPEITQEISQLEEIKEQLYFIEMGGKTKEICEFIIENLEDNGYFKMEINEVSKILNVDYKDVEEALKIIQTLEPAGIGARDLKECFLIQAKRNKDEMLVKFIEECWELLLKRKFNEIGKKMKLDEKEIKNIIEKLKKLNPNPLNLDKKIERKIIPEGRVIREGDNLKVYVDDKISYFLKLNSLYEKYYSSPLLSEKEKRFLTKKIERAKIVIKLVEERRKFLQKVFQEIIDYQKEFFYNGNLYPLKEKDIAEKMNVSISTISRVINGKYLITPKGLLKIKDLFVREFKYSMSRNFIIEKIKEIIKNESTPLSDREIAYKLGYFGIKISPRTVNKYRNKMGIPNSYLR
jgi:RNA polymerase sigma-54 factor